MKRPLKNYIKLIFQRLHGLFGLNILNSRELAGVVSHSLYLKLLPRSIHEFSFENGMTIRGIPFHDYELDPFGECLADQDNQSFNKDKFSRDLLKKIIDEDNKVIGDFNDIFQNEYQHLPLPMFYYPWENFDFNLKEKNYYNLVVQNRSEYLELEDIQDEINLQQIAESHANQFGSLIKEITQNGFDGSLPRPRVIVLKYGNNWKWIMSGQGNHRAYILKYLNYKLIPVEVTKYIDFDRLIKSKSQLGEYGVDEMIRLRNLLFFKNKKCLRGIL